MRSADQAVHADASKRHTGQLALQYMKQTATNMTVGSVLYAAPEQLMGDQIDG